MGRTRCMLGVALACALVLAFPVSSASATLAATPYMGWNSYFGTRGYDQHTITAVARSLIRRGLKKAGYRIVWLDAGWASGARDPAGNIVLRSKQWPKGLPWLTDWLHSHGLLAGIYTDAGKTGCSGRGLGSYGHYQRDAKAFASWGFDAVKVDFCGAGEEGYEPRPLYTAFARALRSTARGRRMIFNVCNFWNPGEIGDGKPTLRNSAWMTATWARAIAQSWRTNSDVGVPGRITFAGVVRNLTRNNFHPRAAGPGHWNDPDYLGPQLGMTSAEAQAQFSMWSVVAAPLIIGSDPRKLSRATVRMLENRRVISIDQDRLGIQAIRIRREGAGQVWVKRLAGGARALALLNTGSNWKRITTSAQAIGLAHGSRLRLVNQWSGASFSARERISIDVAPHSAKLYRVRAL